MDVWLLDGTYELFRHFFAVPSRRDREGNEAGAVIGVLGSVLGLLGDGVTHLGVATDHEIESFRNSLWPGYKTGDGVDPALLGQFLPLEQALAALGVRVWPMTELEADDALASAAARAAADPAVTRVVIASPDKDLAQCVGGKVVQFDRRARAFRDAAAVEARFGVPPASIPDWLALTGDSADGFPGVPGWGAKSSAAVLARYGRLEAIPDDPAAWDVRVRGAARLAATLAGCREEAMLFRELATLRTDAAVSAAADLRWGGPAPGFAEAAARLGAPALQARAEAVARGRRMAGR